MNYQSTENYLINTAFVLLIIKLIISWINLIAINNQNLNINKILKNLIIITNAILFIILSSRWIYNKYFPLSNLYESLLFLTWSLTFIQILTAEKNNSKIILAITTPIPLFILAFTSLCLPTDMKLASPLVPALRSNWLIMHVTVMLISYASLIIGSLLSILFLVISIGKKVNIQGNSYNTNNKILFKYKSQQNNLQNIIDQTNLPKNIITNNISLLEAIDNLSYRIIGFGFPLLTIGIISGAVWANEAWGTYWSWDPKETWALITWIIFAIYLHTRLNKKWQGKKPAIIASLGFIIIWICYLGVNFLGKGLHSYGWILS
uniref:Cytochrome c biogenesis protein CcsA n=1 Tax=Lophocladia kuetzingii TaxID=675577 RepID=A0A1Z1MP14_9FLOR|nr:cytochrome c biogenesis protein ccs1 [Lophocladia kuetzingii]ARW67599.1 cytochrome c biogenesis protein ccs1 [Lophocladia kuetzingii]